MKQKVYFVLVSLMQLIISLVVIVNVNYFNNQDIAQIEKYIEDEKITMNFAPEYSQEYLEEINELQNEIAKLQEDGVSDIKIRTIEFIALNIIILLIVKKGNIFKNRILIACISVIGLFTAYSDISGILCLINLIAVKLAKSDRKEDKPDAKEKIPRIEYKKSTIKEITLGILLIIAFFFPINMLIDVPEESINTAETIYNVVLFGLAIIIFKDKLKHDIKLFKNNAKEYIKYIIPIFGVMMVVQMITSMICAMITRTNNNCK